MGCSRQEYWSGLPFPPPGNLPDPVNEPKSAAFLALTSGFFATEPPGKPRLPKWTPKANSEYTGSQGLDQDGLGFYW